MNGVMIFENEEFSGVRAIEKDGEVWWVLKDIAVNLDLGSGEHVHDRIDDDEQSKEWIETPGGRQLVNLVNESGLYSLIMRSNKAEAKLFKRWITHEVLPSIRKTGEYKAGQAAAGGERLRVADGGGERDSAEREGREKFVTIREMDNMLKYHEQLTARAAVRALMEYVSWKGENGSGESV